MVTANVGQLKTFSSGISTREDTFKKGTAMKMRILGYAGFTVSAISGFMILLLACGIWGSPPIEVFMATFIIGQSSFNGYILGKLK